MGGTRLTCALGVAVATLDVAAAAAQECKTLDGHRREINLPAGWTSSRDTLYAEGDELVRADGEVRALIMPVEPGSCVDLVMVHEGTEHPGGSARPNAFSARYSKFWVMTSGEMVRLAGCLDTGVGAVGVQVNTFGEHVADPGVLALTEAIADAFQTDVRCAWEPEVTTVAASAPESDEPPGKPGPLVSALDAFAVRARYVTRGETPAGEDVPDTVTAQVRATAGSGTVFAYDVMLEGGRGVDGGWAYGLRLGLGAGYTHGRWSGGALVGGGFEGVTGSTTLSYGAPIDVEVIAGALVTEGLHVSARLNAGWLPFAGQGDFAARPPAASLGFADQGSFAIEAVFRFAHVAVSLHDHGGATGVGISVGTAFDPSIHHGAARRPAE